MYDNISFVFLSREYGRIEADTSCCIVLNPTDDKSLFTQTAENAAKAYLRNEPLAKRYVDHSESFRSIF